MAPYAIRYFGNAVKKKPDLMLILFLLFGLGVVVSAAGQVLF